MKNNLITILLLLYCVSIPCVAAQGIFTYTLPLLQFFIVIQAQEESFPEIRKIFKIVNKI